MGRRGIGLVVGAALLLVPGCASTADRPSAAPTSIASPVSTSSTSSTLIPADEPAKFTPDLATDRIVLRLWPNSPNMATAGAYLDPGPVIVAADRAVKDDQARDPWLDEGLASWAEAGYEGTLASFKARALPAAARDRLDRPTTFWDAISADYYAGVYVQGVQALAARGSPARVDCALAVYVAANAYRFARPADLVAALTSAFHGASAVLARYGV